MGIAHQRDIAAALLSHGWAPATPAALLFAASRSDADEWIGTIDLLARGEGPMHADRPGTMVIGNVVSLRHEITPHLTLPREVAR
jgi:siroheme synthase